jgi:hypothetical protein
MSINPDESFMTNIPEYPHVTPEQVRDSCQRHGISVVRHHECAICKYPVAYVVHLDRLYFDPGCNCIDGCNRGLQPRQWDSAAEWINTQPTIEQKTKTAALFGIVLNPNPTEIL